MGGGFEPVDKSSSPPATKLQVGMYSSLVVGIGLIGAVQTVVNNRAGEHFNSFLIGSWIEFAGGALCILFCVGFEMAWEKRGSFLRMNRCLHWRDIVPGCISMVFVCAMVGLTTVTGFSLFFIGAVVGQLLASATFDQFGLCGGLKMPLKRQQFIAIACAVVGAVLSAVDTLANTKSEFSPGIVGACTACAIGAGTLLPLQAAMNRQLSDALPSKMQATLFSFTVGLIICSIAVGVQVGVDSDLAASIPNSISTSADAIWLYFGGPGGMLYIASGIWFMRLIGAAAFFVSLICGQLAGGAIMDATGFLGARVIESSATRVAGVCIVMVASILMQVDVPQSWVDGCNAVLCCKAGRSYQAIEHADEETGAGKTEQSPLLVKLGAGRQA